MKRFVNIKSMATIAMIALFSVSVVAMAPDKKKKKKNADTTTEVQSQRKTLYEELLEKEAKRNTGSTGRQTNNRTTGANVKEDYGKTVTLVTSGTGATEDEATRVALRSAIEQAFGTFVSANTSVINDELVKDEIATVSSGNVVGYNLVSKVSTPDGGCQVSVQSTVSIGKLVAFAQNHGMSAELSGNTFLHNRNLALLNRRNEIEALSNLTTQLALIAEQGLYDFSVEVGQPRLSSFEDKERLFGQGKGSSSSSFYTVGAHIKATPNANFTLFWETIKNTLSSLHMSQTERSNYATLGIGYYTFFYSFSYPTDYKMRDYESFSEWETGVDKAVKYFLRNDLGVMTKNGGRTQLDQTHFFETIALFLKMSKYSFEIFDNLGTVVSPVLCCNISAGVNNNAKSGGDGIQLNFLRRNDQLKNWGYESGYGIPASHLDRFQRRTFPIGFIAKNPQLSLSAPFTNIRQLFHGKNINQKYIHESFLPWSYYQFKHNNKMESYDPPCASNDYIEEITMNYNEKMLSNLQKISIRPCPLQILPQQQNGIYSILRERNKR